MDTIVYRLSSKAPPGEVNLKPEAWRVLTQVNGARSLAEIAQAIGMAPEAVNVIAGNLYQAGVLEVASGNVAPTRTTVGGAFFEQIGRELARAIGPLAQIILDEEMDKLGETRTEFPVDRIPDLVERVSEAIDDDTKRITFQQVMLEAIRKL